MRTKDHLVVFIALAVLMFAGVSSTYGAPEFAPHDPGAARASDVYSKDEVDNLTAQSTLRYYFQEASADVVGYESFATSPVAIQATEAKTLNTTVTLIDQWITPANTPNLTTLVTGVYEVIGYLTKSGAGTAYLATELWIYHADTSMTFVASSTYHASTGVMATPFSEVFRFNIPSAVTTVDTDRLVVKLYGYRSAVAAIVLYYGGDTGSFFGVPISPRNFMRVDASNAEAATARTNLGLGTMAVKPATDYVATLTLTAHEGDTSTHGVAQIANAADYLRLDGTATMTGHLKFSGNYGLRQITASGTDNGYISLAGGGLDNSDQGAYAYVFGNQYPTLGGSWYIEAGKVVTGCIRFRTGGYERMQVNYNGNIGIATNTPGNLLTMEASGGGYYSSSTHQWANGTCLEERKFDIQPVDFNPVDAIKKLEIKKYKYKKYVEEKHPITGAVISSEWVEDPNAIETYGYIADDVPIELNKMIDAEGHLGTRDAFAFLAAVCRAQQEQITSLTQRVQALEDK